MGAYGSNCSAGFRDLFRATLAELVGSFLFCASFALILENGFNNAGVLDALALGVIFAVLVFHGMGVSGGHYNPAITIGVAISNSQFGSLRMVYYLVAQFVGAILGGLLSINLISETFTFPVVSDAVGFNQPKAFFLEFFFAFLMVITVIQANARGADYGIYVGAVQFVGSVAALGHTGSCFNPALAAGLYAGSNHIKKLEDTKDFWLYLFAPLVGGIMAAIYAGLLVLLEGGVSVDSSSEEDTDNETPGVELPSYTMGAPVVMRGQVPIMQAPGYNPANYVVAQPAYAPRPVGF